MTIIVVWATKPDNNNMENTMIEVGTRLKYEGTNGEVMASWWDGMEYRAEIQYLRGKQIWCVTVNTLLEQNPKLKKELT